MRKLPFTVILANSSRRHKQRLLTSGNPPYFQAFPALTSNPHTQAPKTSILDTQRTTSNPATQLCENLIERSQWICFYRAFRFRLPDLTWSPISPEIKPFSAYFPSFLDINTTVST